MEVVEQAWDEEINGSPMWRFHLKLKNTAKRLSEWSRNSIGNIFDKVNAELIRAVKKEENYWKQKAGIRCVWRTLSNVWYSVNINGGRYGFFKSTRGIKQGDPLSPSLFDTGAELLSRLMDKLVNDGFIPYVVDRKGPIITHSSYADDTVWFSTNDPESLKMMMDNLNIYEQCSR
ncbi:uncharacterized protein LOC107778314 [Nicotiana tabacum]|uniref:Uncharacterized protein LOC107778314 n=1 Tax=Nicotiana tabacum TaxID=4097 RepID=A0AC58S771_TOBAC